MRHEEAKALQEAIAARARKEPELTVANLAARFSTTKDTVFKALRAAGLRLYEERARQGISRRGGAV